ncbi:probable glycosyltransferase At5g03795 [Olea europaea subsp. europaea]|uniref:Probable glycosyltransferase At5g03795 n=1 Tax=Olea europaea subsp. europaea TaxID=158383 RepID=A0A8S0R5T8_OLEEU|nr:probable glycosyltransferase At5g03795 [Olea europaea subsp. europaea]
MQGILGMEGILIHHIEISKFRTTNPERANRYFLPFSVPSIVSYVYVVDSHLWGPMQNTAGDYVNLIAQKYPYWNRSLGHDHFMLAFLCCLFDIYTKTPLEYYVMQISPKNSTPLPMCPCPKYLPQGTMDGLIGGTFPSKRSSLVFYAGGIHGYIRQVLMEHWKNKDSDVQIHEYLPKNMSYYGMVRKSKYCICPGGWEVASPRMVEALYVFQYSSRTIMLNHSVMF